MTVATADFGVDRDMHSAETKVSNKVRLAKKWGLHIYRMFAIILSWRQDHLEWQQSPLLRIITSNLSRWPWPLMVLSRWLLDNSSCKFRMNNLKTVIFNNNVYYADTEREREREMQIFLLNDMLAGWVAAARVCGPRCEINCGVRQSTMVDYLFIFMNFGIGECSAV